MTKRHFQLNPLLPASASFTLHLEIMNMMTKLGFIGLTVIATAPAVNAQQWGLLYPDGSIRDRNRVLLLGPSPSRMLDVQQTLPVNRLSVDLNNGAIYRGSVIESGPSPIRRLMICTQTGLC